MSLRARARCHRVWRQLQKRRVEVTASVALVSVRLSVLCHPFPSLSHSEQRADSRDGPVASFRAEADRGSGSARPNCSLLLLLCARRHSLWHDPELGRPGARLREGLRRPQGRRGAWVGAAAAVQLSPRSRNADSVTRWLGDLGAVFSLCQQSPCMDV